MTDNIERQANIYIQKEKKKNEILDEIVSYFEKKDDNFKHEIDERGQQYIEVNGYFMIDDLINRIYKICAPYKILDK